MIVRLYSSGLGDGSPARPRRRQPRRPLVGRNRRLLTRALLARVAAALLLLASDAAMAQTPPSVTLTGVLQDQTGAILPGGSVDLLTAAGAVVKSTKTDQAGVFRFETVAPGTYDLRAAFEGFAPGSIRVRISTRPPAPQKLVLK